MQPQQPSFGEPPQQPPAFATPPSGKPPKKEVLNRVWVLWLTLCLCLALASPVLVVVLGLVGMGVALGASVGKLPISIAPKRAQMHILGSLLMLMEAGAGFWVQSQLPSDDVSEGPGANFGRQQRAAQQRQTAAEQQQAAAQRQAAQLQRSTAPARQAGLVAELARWQWAEAQLLEESEPDPARLLLQLPCCEAEGPVEGMPAFNAEEQRRLCAHADSSCVSFRTQQIEPIRQRLHGWIYWMHTVDDGREQLAEAAASETGTPISRAMIAQMINTQVDDRPDPCPDAVCSRARERTIQAFKRAYRPWPRRFRTAVRDATRANRRSMAAQLDQALSGTGIDGTIRTEGSNADKLVLNYALCGRPVVEQLFDQGRNLDGWQRAGFRWIGCKSYFRRYGYDLDPPDLMEQTVPTDAMLGTN